jgi:hypothetical protein
MTRAWLVSPLGLLFAWSGAWTCQQFTNSDGGTSSFNQNPPPTSTGGGGGSKTGTQTVNTQVDGGTSGVGLFVVIAADGGGVTLGPVANFHSNFAWIANDNGTVSLIDTDLAQEVGNYPAAVPLDMAGNNFCKGNPAAYGPNISGAMSCMLQNPTCEATSRTVVDLNGGVWAANRAWSTNYCGGGCQVDGDSEAQPSITHINNSIEHLADPNYPLASCTVRCPGRNGGASVTSPIVAGVPQTIAPWSPYYTSTAALWCPDPTGTLAAEGSKPDVIHGGVKYVDPTDYCNPVNYDDCAMYTIPIGAHDGYNQNGIDTQGNYLARGTVIAPNCDPLTRECDIWVGLSWGGLAVRLSGKQPNDWPFPGFDVHEPTAAIPMATDAAGNQVALGSDWGGATPYGAVIDCRGYLWGDNPGGGPQPDGSNGHMLYGIDTNAIDASGHATTPPISQFKIVAPDSSGACASGGTVCNGFPVPWKTTGQCGSYGTAVDVQGRIWLARYDQGNGACDFDPGKWLTQIGGVGKLGSLSYPTYDAAITAFNYPVTWQSYNTDYLGGGGTPSVGIVSDKNGNVFPTLFCYGSGNGSGALGFVPDTGVVDAQGNETGFEVLFSKFTPTAAQPGYCTHGIDVAVDASLPGGEALWGTDDSGNAVKFDPTTGNILKNVPINRTGFYTYSDFTGYALRFITSPEGEYTQVLQGTGSAPEFTVWQSVTFTATVPPIDDLLISVRVGNSIPELAAAADTQVCDVAAGCTSPVDIGSLDLEGEYLAIDFTLVTPGCSGDGLYPVLYTTGATSTGPGN